MTDWISLEEKLCERFFPHNRFMESKTAIAVFTQGANESLNEAWERFKSMLRKCKGHDFDELSQIHIFRNGLQLVHKTLLDATAGGSLLSKTAEEATVIIDRMALNDHQGSHNRGPSQKTPGVLELGTNDAILAQNKLLSQQVELLTKQMSKLPQQFKEMHDSSSKNVQVLVCELCRGDHLTGHCPPDVEEVNYTGNQGYQPRPPYQQGNQGYQQRGNQGYQQPWKPQEVGPSNRQQYQNYTQPPQAPIRNTEMEDTLTQFMQMSISNQKNTDAAIRNLETQVGQLSKQLADQSKGNFTANTLPNPKEHCKAILTRSGREIDMGVGEVVVEDEVVVEKEKDSDEIEVEKNVEGVLVENEKEKREIDEKRMSEERIKKTRKGKEPLNNIPIQHLPYPHAPTKKDSARHYARFMDIFKQLQINIPFSEALEQMPKYAKFMKDILTKKKRYTDQETIMVDASCSAIIQRTLPRKERDP